MGQKVIDSTLAEWRVLEASKERRRFDELRSAFPYEHALLKRRILATLKTKAQRQIFRAEHALLKQHCLRRYRVEAEALSDKARKAAADLKTALRAEKEMS